MLVVNTRPGELPAGVRLAFTFEGDAAGTFRRGDANGDGRLNIVDVLAVLHHVSGSAGALPCADALDSDDSGAIDLTDALTVLNYLFQPPSGPPRAPFEECGLDPTADALECAGGACP